ncbi:unnamed protein product [Pedinophyceae sp. YPF-701]|nr:unnamed protein product [Pedinophyceae sp. YPF-701]
MDPLEPTPQLTPQLLHKLCKKVAQLTKVVYDLHTSAEDHEHEIQWLQERNATESRQAQAGALEQLARMQEDLARAIDDSQALKVAEQLRAAYDERSAATRARVDVLEEQLKEREDAMHHQAAGRTAEMEERVAGLQSRLEAAVESVEQSRAEQERIRCAFDGLHDQLRTKTAELRQEQGRCEDLEGRLRDSDAALDECRRQEALLNDGLRRLQADLERTQQDLAGQEVRAGEAEVVLDMERQRMRNERATFESALHEVRETTSAQLRTLQEEHTAATTLSERVIEELRSESGALRRRNEQLEKELLEMQGKYSECDRRASIAERERDEARSRLNERTEEVKRATSEHLRAKDDGGVLSRKVADVERSLADTTEQLAATKARCASLEAEIAEHATHHTDVQKAAASETQKLRQDLQEALRAHAETREQLRAAEKVVEEQAAQLGELDDIKMRAESLQDECAGRVREVALLASQLQDAREHAKAMEAASHTMRTGIDAEVAELRGRHQAEMAAKDAEAAQLHDTISRLKADVCDLQAHAKAEGDEAQALHAARIARIQAEHEDALRKLQVSNESMATELRARESEAARIAGELTTSDQRCSELSSMLRESEESRAGLQRALDASTGELSQMRAQVDSLTETVKRLRADLDLVKSAGSEQDQLVQKLLNERDSAAATAEASRSALRSLEAEHAKEMEQLKNREQALLDRLRSKESEFQASSAQLSLNITTLKEQNVVLEDRVSTMAEDLRREVNRSEEVTERFELHRKETEASVASLESQLKGARLEAEAASSRVRVLEEEAKVLGERTRRAERALHDVQGQVNDVLSRAQKAEQRVATLEHDGLVKDRALNDATEVHRKLQAALDAAAQAIESQSADSNRKSEAHETALRDMTNQIRELRHAVSASEARVEDVESRSQAVEQNLRRIITDLEIERDRLAQEVEARPAREQDVAAIEHLTTELRGKNRLLSDLERQVAELKAELQNREENYNMRFANGGAGINLRPAQPTRAASGAAAGQEVLDWIKGSAQPSRRNLAAGRQAPPARMNSRNKH